MKTAKIVVKIEAETTKAIKVMADVYRDNDMSVASTWLPKSQVQIAELKNDPTSLNTHIVELPVWLFNKVEQQTNAEWHNIK